MNRRGFFGRMAGLLAFPFFSKVPSKGPVREVVPAGGGKNADSGFCDPRWADSVLNRATGELTYVGHDFFIAKEASDVSVQT